MEQQTMAYHPETPLHAPVSVFRNYRSTKPEETTRMVTFLTKSFYEEEIQRIRTTADKKERDRLKSYLPACTPSGVFSKREASALLRHSGLIQFDIDFKDNMHIGNYGQLKNELSNIRNIAYCGLSVSGTGYWGLVQVKYPDKHPQHFVSLQKLFSLLGINIDPSCSDVSRMRGYSFDNEAYFNFSPETFCSYENRKAPHFMAGAGSLDNLQKVEQAVCFLESNKLVLCPHYKTWIEVACSLAAAFGEGGRPLFHRISKLHGHNSVQETESTYDSCLKKQYGYTLGTFFFHVNNLMEQVECTVKSWVP